MVTMNEHRTEHGRNDLIAMTNAGSLILEKIATRQAVVSIVGLGYVGLPLMVAFAEAGFRVVGVDVDTRKVAGLNAGQSHVSDVPAERIAALLAPLSGLRRQQMYTNSVSDDASMSTPNGHGTADVGMHRHAGSLSATTDFNIISEVDAVIICVPTPLGTTKDPDMSYIVAVTDEIARHLHPGMLVVLESTTYPGTTEELILPRLEHAQVYQHRSSNGNGHGDPSVGRSSMVVGRDFFLAFSPERIDPGRTDWTVSTTPKVIGGVTPTCLKVTQALYECAIERVVPVSLPKTAEMVKLLENTFRAVNIGLINEVAIMCDRLGVDVWEVIEAAKTKPFGFMPFYPGPGLGGHCIPIDPQYLAWKLKTLNYNARFIQLAAEINFGMPHYVLGKIADALNKQAKALKGSHVLILGVSYKADVGDLRESPALDLLHLLIEKGVDVAYHDPYVPQLNLDGHTIQSVTLDREALQRSDCVVIAAAHTSYDWEWVVAHSHLIMDTRNTTRHIAAPHAHIVRL
ncbi:MAG: nucleotide sugar dehydrogenase [Chloroflexales bacterium]